MEIMNTEGKSDLLDVDDTLQIHGGAPRESKLVGTAHMSLVWTVDIEGIKALQRE